MYQIYKYTHTIQIYSQNTKYILSKYKIYTQNKSTHVHKINAVKITKYNSRVKIETWQNISLD